MLLLQSIRAFLLSEMLLLSYSVWSSGTCVWYLQNSDYNRVRGSSAGRDKCNRLRQTSLRRVNQSAGDRVHLLVVQSLNKNKKLSETWIPFFEVVGWCWTFRRYGLISDYFTSTSAVFFSLSAGKHDPCSGKLNKMFCLSVFCRVPSKTWWNLWCSPWTSL